MPVATRKRYSPEFKEKVLRMAEVEGLTAGQVAKEYGIHPVTFYTWRNETVRAGAKHKGSGLTVHFDRESLEKTIEQLIRAEVRMILQG